MVAQIDFAYIKYRPSKLLSRLVSYGLFEGRPVTTKGQWINPLLFAHFLIWKRLPQLRKVEKPIFILGTGRSGTTILGILLSMHRNVGFLNEPKAMWHSICDQEDVIGSYSRGDAHYRLDASNVTAQTRTSAHRLFGAYLRSIFSGRLVDKYPELVFRVPFVRAIFPDARFIFLVRNGWDTCASIDKWSGRCGEQSNGEIHDWWGVNQRKWKLMVRELIVPDPYYSNILDVVPTLHRHVDMAALEWVVTMREGLRRMKDNSDCILMIRYEDLTQSPRKVLSDIAQFVHLQDDKTFLDYAEVTLKPSRSHPEFSIHPKLRPLFDETMSALGYQ